MLILIDNYDSFTFNLVHLIAGVGVSDIEVIRNDAAPAAEVVARAAAIVLSPGPCDPDRAGMCLEVVRRAAEARVPLLGVCLGHQAIGQAFGGRVVRAPRIMHGKTDAIRHGGRGLFAGLPSPLTATRYHSLTVARDDLPEALEVTAEAEDGTIMGLSHRSLPIHGLQFHPESIASEHGAALVRAFLSPVPA